MRPVNEQNQWLADKFPAQWNRESSNGHQGRSNGHQGRYVDETEKFILPITDRLPTAGAPPRLSVDPTHTSLSALRLTSSVDIQLQLGGVPGGPSRSCCERKASRTVVGAGLDNLPRSQQGIGGARGQVQRPRTKRCKADARPASQPSLRGLKEAACSWRVTMSLMLGRRSDSTTSRFSSPGTPKIRSTPSFSKAATSRSEPSCEAPDAAIYTSEVRRFGRYEATSAGQ